LLRSGQSSIAPLAIQAEPRKTEQILTIFTAQKAAAPAFCKGGRKLQQAAYSRPAAVFATVGNGGNERRRHACFIEQLSRGS